MQATEREPAVDRLLRYAAEIGAEPVGTGVAAWGAAA
jgi:hypothetical protein